MPDMISKRTGLYALTGMVYLLLFFLFYGCTNEKAKTADEIMKGSLDAIGKKADRDKIQNLVSLAACISPNGKYSTEVHTALGGYAYFKQVYSYKPKPFEAVILNKISGYMMADSIKPLSKESIYTIRSHEFHNMILEADQRFHDLKRKETAENDRSRLYCLSAKDELDHACLLFFDIKTGLLSAIHFQNPVDAKEIIKTSFSNWEKMQGLFLPRQVNIDQSGKKYVFNFGSVDFNSPGFCYKNIQE